MSARLPVHLEVSGLIRAVDAAGGFATVLAKGERDAGTLLIVTTHNGADSCAWERMPRPDGVRVWQVTRREDPADPGAFTHYWQRRREQDEDLWVLELDIADAKRFIDDAGTYD